MGQFSQIMSYLDRETGVGYIPEKEASKKGSFLVILKIGEQTQVSFVPDLEFLGTSPERFIKNEGRTGKLVIAFEEKDKEVLELRRCGVLINPNVVTKVERVTRYVPAVYEDPEVGVLISLKEVNIPTDEFYNIHYFYEATEVLPKIEIEGKMRVGFKKKNFRAIIIFVLG